MNFVSQGDPCCFQHSKNYQETMILRVCFGRQPGFVQLNLNFLI